MSGSGIYYFILFGILLVLDFVLFHWALFTLLLAKGETYKMEKGRRLLVIAFILFLFILLIVFVFYVITYFLGEVDIFQPSPGVSAEFPYPSHISLAPSGPEFIKIGRYYFAGPWLLKDNEFIEKSAIAAVLCKKGEDYDIIYLDEEYGIQLSKHEQYGCWLENCDNNLNNLYLALIWTYSNLYTPERKDKIITSFKNQFNNLPCSGE